MYCLIDFCCICFDSKEHLQRLSDFGNDNITYLIKLTSCVSEMCFNQMNNKRLICNKCCEMMDAAYKFRQKCLRSKTTLIDYISQLRTVSNISGAANVYLIDINKTDDLGKYQKENNIEVTKMFKNLNEDANDTENSVIKRELNPTSLKLFDTGENFIQLENVIIKMEQNYQISEEYKESSDNLSISENEIDVRQNFVSLTSSVIKEENKNQDFEENLQEKFDNILETSDNVNNDTATRLEKNYDYFLNSKKCADDLSVNLNEIKVEIVENDIESAKREINILSEVADIEGFSNDKHIFPLKDENEADNEMKFSHKILKVEQKNTSLSKNIQRNECDVVNRKEKIVKKHECSICKKNFTQSSTLNHHIRTHTGERPFECEFCQKKFSQSVNLRNHIRIHTGKKPYACEVCQKKFNVSSNLKKHMLIHTGDKTHECEVCKKKFNHSSNLMVHIRLHNEKKPYGCDVCEKKFSQLINLRNHMRVHSGEKPNECGVCQKKFSQLSNFKIHMRIHSGKKPYACDVCHKTFTQSSNLTIHKRIHNRDKSL